MDMKKLDRAGAALNRILGIAYVPFLLFSFLMGMGSDAAAGATHPLYVFLYNAVSYIMPISGLLTIPAIFLSVSWRREGRSIPSFIVQFAPLILFGIGLLMMAAADTLPRHI